MVGESEEGAREEGSRRGRIFSGSFRRGRLGFSLLEVVVDFRRIFEFFVRDGKESGY